MVYQLDTTGSLTKSLRLYNDATVHYLGKEHYPYAIVAMAFILIFGALPTLLLLVYPLRCFQKLLGLFPIRWHVLHTFVDTFHGCYKDGTEPGTRDCRWLVSVLLIARFGLLAVGVLTFNPTFFPIASMVLVKLALLFLTLQPFKSDSSHLTNGMVVFLLVLAVAFLCILGAINDANEVKHTLPLFLVILILTAVLPLLYVTMLILCWLHSNRLLFVKIVQKLKFF